MPHAPALQDCTIPQWEGGLVLRSTAPNAKDRLADCLAGSRVVVHGHVLQQNHTQLLLAVYVLRGTCC